MLHFSGDPAPNSLADAETFASTLLAQPQISAEAVVKLAELLPPDSSQRPSSGSGAFLFSSGAYVLGGINGLFGNATRFPQATQVLTRFAKQSLQSDFLFSSCVLMQDNETKLHRDINNVGRSALIRCSPFQGGELWLESPSGTVPSGGPSPQRYGELHALEDHVVFDPTAYHCTRPWSQGPRVVLAIYTGRGCCL